MRKLAKLLVLIVILGVAGYAAYLYAPGRVNLESLAFWKDSAPTEAEPPAMAEPAPAPQAPAVAAAPEPAETPQMAEAPAPEPAPAEQAVAEEPEPSPAMQLAEAQARAYDEPEAETAEAEETRAPEAPAPVAAAAAPEASERAKAAIRARRGFYQLVGYSFGPIVAMAKGEMPYDEAVADGHAANLAALSFYDLTQLFPEGTSNADMPGETRALPAIWENIDDVGRKISDFRVAVADLSAAVTEGQDALLPAVSALGKTCGACHDDYRARDF